MQQYGWEFPSQLLVVVIVFTYAIICPIILPVALLYFMGSLIVYKKQVLYVYTPIYESGGALFSSAVQHTLFGLVCGQLTLLGYFGIRGSRYQPILLLPLPLFTIYGMGYFKEHYAEPSKLLSMERAREYDRASEFDYGAATSPINGIGLSSPSGSTGLEARQRTFDKNSYRQPVLNKQVVEPLPYRRGRPDELTTNAREVLHKITQLGLDSSRHHHHNDGNDDDSIRHSPKLNAKKAPLL